MKIKIFLILNVLLLVGCCKKVSLNPQTGLPWGWNPMPHERIKSYFPLNVGTQVTYISEKGENKVFKCTDLYYHYQNTFGNSYGMFSKFVPYEDCSYSMKLEYFKDKYYGKEFLKSDIDIVMNRIRANISYNHSYYNHKNEIKKSCGGVVDKWFEQDKTKNMGMGWPKNPNEFIDYLTDTIVLTQSNNPEKTMGMLVAGKGLVWFTDSDGIRWALKE